MSELADLLERETEGMTPGPWTGTTEGSYDQKHAAAKAFEAVMARRVPDVPDAQWSDMSWVRTEGDAWLNIACVGNGAASPENARAIAFFGTHRDAILAALRHSEDHAAPLDVEAAKRAALTALRENMPPWEWWSRELGKRNGSDDVMGQFVRTKINALIRAALAGSEEQG